jgi:hypothetical protein
VWVDDPITDTPDWDEYKDRFTYATAGKFLLAHPGRALVILNNGGSDFQQTRPNYLGSYPESAGKPESAMSFSILTPLASPSASGGMYPLILLWGGMTAIGIWLIRSSRRGSLRRAFVAASLFLISVAAVQLATAVFGEAIENTKHMVYGILAGAIGVAFFITATTLRGQRTETEQS